MGVKRMIFFQGPKDQERAEAQGNTRSPLQLEGTDRPTKGNDRSGPLQLSGTTVPSPFLFSRHFLLTRNDRSQVNEETNFCYISVHVFSTLCNKVH